MRFWAVDYRAEVWLNGVRLGLHHGPESPFLLDATAAIKRNTANRLAVHRLGAGRFVLNTLRTGENLGRHPVAERLLRNLLRYASQEMGKPAAPLPVEFDSTPKTLGYP